MRKSRCALERKGGVVGQPLFVCPPLTARWQAARLIRSGEARRRHRVRKDKDRRGPPLREDCSGHRRGRPTGAPRRGQWAPACRTVREIGRASCRERVCQYVWIAGVAETYKKKKKK